jgi:hypothetical protein
MILSGIGMVGTITTANTFSAVARRRITRAKTDKKPERRMGVKARATILNARIITRRRASVTSQRRAETASQPVIVTAFVGSESGRIACGLRRYDAITEPSAVTPDF